MEGIVRILSKCCIWRWHILIFITVGTQKFQFNRLLEYIDEKVSTGEIKEKIFAQIGSSTYIPKNYEYKDYIDKNEFSKNIEKSDLIITHAGVGTIITAINKNKKVIVVPRLSKYKEHVDNHQLEIAESFSNKNFVLSNGENIEELLSNIKKAKSNKFDKYNSSNEKIQDLIIEFVENEGENNERK